MQTLAVPLQTETRPDEGLALTWIEVSGAIRYGLVIGVPGVPMPDLDSIMRGQSRQFAILGIPARFTGAVDIGTPAGATRQFGLVAYRSDGGIFPISSLQIHPARSAPRDREYHAVVPPALVDASPKAQPTKAADPNDPWSVLEAATPTTPTASPTNVTFSAPRASSEATPYTVAQPSPMPASSQTSAPYDPWDVLSHPPANDPVPETAPSAEPTPSYEDRYEAPAQAVPYEPTPSYEAPVAPLPAEPEPMVEQPWTPEVEPESYVAPPIEPVAYEPPPVSLPEPHDNGRATDAADEPAASVEAVAPTEIVSATPNINQADRDSSTISSPGDEWNPSTVPSVGAAGEPFTSPPVSETTEPFVTPNGGSTGGSVVLPGMSDSAAQPSTPALDSVWEQPAPPVVNVEPEPWSGDAETTARFEPARVQPAPPVETIAAAPANGPVSPAPEVAPSPPAPPLPTNLGALLDEAELYLLPQWADSAAALSLVEEVEREAPGHPRTREVRARIENMIAGGALAVEEPDSAIEDDSATPAAQAPASDVEDPASVIEGNPATIEPIGVEEPPLIIEEDPAVTLPSGVEEAAPMIEDDSTQITDLLEMGAAVDYYEQVRAAKPEYEAAGAEPAHTRAGTPWPLRLAESAGDATALRELGKDIEEEAPDLAGQAYAAAFAIQPAPDVLRGWLTAFGRAGHGEVIAGTARRAVRVLEESGKIVPNPAITDALESLDQAAGGSGAELESAVHHLCDALVGASQ